jgi:hypothetical protein
VLGVAGFITAFFLTIHWLDKRADLSKEYLAKLVENRKSLNDEVWDALITEAHLGK